jgi:hypothetical protein
MFFMNNKQKVTKKNIYQITKNLEISINNSEF